MVSKIILTFATVKIKIILDMRIKLNFDPNTKPIHNPLNKEVNGFINNVLGIGNEYHGKFSRYSVSSMQGGHMDKNGVLNFPNGGYVFVSSDSDEFISKFLRGISKKRNLLYVFDMKYKSMDIKDFKVNERFDLVRTISPILLSSKDKKVLTFQDEEFISILTEKSKKKLIKCGYDKNLVDTLNMRLFHPENSRTKMVQVGEQKNIASKIMLYVEGDKSVRKALYELGIGKCTGFGFGSVSININNNK